ncbi:MAG: serine hydrolase domain-containing protein [Propionibacteriaceae bacterium]
MSSDPDPRLVLRSISAYLADWARFQAEYRGAAGVQLAVAHGDEVIVDLAWGLADSDSGESLTTEHLFRVASHSKTMTAVIVLRLVEDGRLRLDDRADAHVPELAGSAIAGVTVRELLGHQAGIIRDSSDGDFWQHERPFLDRDQLLDVLRTEGNVFASNEHFKYTNIGYSLLGLIVERVSGSTYAELGQEFVVQPLGLERTGPEYAPERAGEYASGHTGRTAYGDPRRVIPHVDTRAMASATGWYSTAREMTRYGRAHVFGDETLLTDASKRLMQREESRVLVREREIGRYGLGLDLRTIGDRELIGHSGGYPGHITRTWIDPTDGLVVSCLTNSVDGPADAIATGIIQLVDLALKAAAEKPDPIPTGSVPTDQIPTDQIPTGRFANLWGVTDLVDLGGILHAIQSRMPEPATAHQRLAFDGDRLVLEPVPGFGPTGEEVAVERGADGEIQSVRLGAMTAWPIERFREGMSAGNPAGIAGRMSP